MFRLLFDLTFFFLVIVIIIQNLVFGVIIDTFSDLRAEKNKDEDMIKNTCFICGQSCRLEVFRFLKYCIASIFQGF